MGVIYKLGYFFPFLIIYFWIYKEFFNNRLLSLFLWVLHFYFTVVGGKIFFMIFNNIWDFSIIFKPCCMVSVGVISFAYLYLLIIGLMFKKDILEMWRRLSIISPLGIILIRICNIYNNEAKGFINYASMEIVGAFIMFVFFLFSEKARKNATEFVLVFYPLWRLLISEPFRGGFLNTKAYFFIIPLFPLALIFLVIIKKYYKIK